ncbi:hypothetical protein V2J09_007725 [Rumex salicifolius]
MWRSIARASLGRSAGSKKLCSFHNQSQVLTKALSPKPSPSHFASTPAFLENPYFRNPRYFSQSSIEHNELEPAHEPLSGDISNLGSAEPEKIDGNAEFGETSVEDLLDESSENIEGLGMISEVTEEIDEQKNEADVKKLEELLSLLQSSVDGSLKSNLDGLELNIDEEFVLRILETPLIPGGHLIQFFRWIMETKKGFQITSPLLDALVCGVCQNLKRNDTYALWDLIKEIGEKESGLLNAGILNGLIASLSRLGKGKAAYEVFNKFEGFGCVPNADTYYYTIEALCRRSIFNWASLVANKMLDSSILPESEKIGQIICSFCRGQHPKEAHLVYLSAKQHSKLPPQNAVKFLITALSRVDDTVDLALELLDDLSPEARRRAINQYTHVIQGLCRMKNTNKAKDLLLKMVEAGPPPGNTVFNSVINSLSKAGDVEDAVATLRILQGRGLKPDVYTYSVIISGYTKGGSMDEACKLLKEAKKEHSKLCPTIFHTLIRGYCKLKEYGKALKLLKEMKKYGVEPNVDEYNKLIQSLCLDALDWKRAEKLLDQMKQKGLFLPGITKGLINAVKELEKEAKQEAKQEALANVEATPVA